MGTIEERVTGWKNWLRSEYGRTIISPAQVGSLWTRLRNLDIPLEPQKMYPLDLKDQADYAKGIAKSSSDDTIANATTGHVVHSCHVVYNIHFCPPVYKCDNPCPSETYRPRAPWDWAHIPD